MAQTYDLLAIGAGPAGCASAITAAADGAAVCLIDRATPPRQRPGETLHPGAVLLLERLGFGGAVTAGRFVRVPGIAIVTEAGCRFEAYGADDGGPWCGVQVLGATLDVLLRRRAAAQQGCTCLPHRLCSLAGENRRTRDELNSWRTDFAVPATLPRA